MAFRNSQNIWAFCGLLFVSTQAFFSNNRTALAWPLIAFRILFYILFSIFLLFSNMETAAPASVNNQTPAKLRLFVGQIPREWTEAHVRSLFSKYGELQEVSILRHQDTLISKGCAFVTFVNDESAVQAIEELHDKYSPSEGRKIQVRDACAPRSLVETGRLYCSNLAETTTGNQIFDLFSQVGKVLSVSILMTPWNRSKCSCLVEMANKSNAQAVIDHFHGKYKLAGATSEISVTWARNNGSKNRISTSLPTFEHQPQMLAMDQSYQHMYFPNSHTAATAAQFYDPFFTHSNPMVSQPSHIASQAQTTTTSMLYDEEEEKFDEGIPPAGYSLAPTNMLQHHPHSVSGAPPVHPQMIQYPHPMSSYPPVVFIAVPVSHVPAMSPLVNTNNKSFSKRKLSQSSLLSSPGSPRYKEGPNGANLFVKNFPQEWETKDLASLFSPYGEIVSCNIFMDRLTRKSKGFGFVSFANRESATLAVNELNGKSIGEELLIVEPKRKEHFSFQHHNSSSYNVLETQEDDDDLFVTEEELRAEYYLRS